MIVKYSAHSWTLPASELKKIFVSKIKALLLDGLEVTKERLKDDPDRDEVLKIINSLVAEAEAGNASPVELVETVSWSWQFQDLDPIMGGGSVGKCTYYAEVPAAKACEIQSGCTSVVVERPDYHLNVKTEITV